MGFVSKIFGGGRSEAPQPVQAPSVSAEPVQTEADKEKMRRVGRAALIATSSRGVLGNATTSRQQLTAG